MKNNHFKNLFKRASIKINESSVSVSIDVTRFGEKLDSSQNAMKEQLIQSMLQYVPTGETRALYNDIKRFNESNEERDAVYAFNPNGVPYGHYQWEGIMYADPKTGKGAFYTPEYGFWSRSDTEKVPTTRLLSYSNPQAKRDWLRYAAEHHKDDVVKAAKEGFKK